MVFFESFSKLVEDSRCKHTVLVLFPCLGVSSEEMVGEFFLQWHLRVFQIAFSLVAFYFSFCLSLFPIETENKNAQWTNNEKRELFFGEKLRGGLVACVMVSTQLNCNAHSFCALPGFMRRSMNSASAMKRFDTIWQRWDTNERNTKPRSRPAKGSKQSQLFLSKYQLVVVLFAWRHNNKFKSQTFCCGWRLLCPICSSSRFHWKLILRIRTRLRGGSLLLIWLYCCTENKEDEQREIHARLTHDDGCSLSDHSQIEGTRKRDLRTKRVCSNHKTVLRHTWPCIMRHAGIILQSRKHHFWEINGPHIITRSGRLVAQNCAQTQQFWATRDKWGGRFDRGHTQNLIEQSGGGGKRTIGHKEALSFDLKKIQHAQEKIVVGCSPARVFSLIANIIGGTCHRSRTDWWWPKQHPQKEPCLPNTASVDFLIHNKTKNAIFSCPANMPASVLALKTLSMPRPALALSLAPPHPSLALALLPPRHSPYPRPHPLRGLLKHGHLTLQGSVLVSWGQNFHLLVFEKNYTGGTKRTGRVKLSWWFSWRGSAPCFNAKWFFTKTTEFEVPRYVTTRVFVFLHGDTASKYAVAFKINDRWQPLRADVLIQSRLTQMHCRGSKAHCQDLLLTKAQRSHCLGTGFRIPSKYLPPNWTHFLIRCFYLVMTASWNSAWVILPRTSSQHSSNESKSSKRIPRSSFFTLGNRKKSAGARSGE